MVIIFNDSPQVPNRSIGAYRIATALRKQGIEVEVIDFLSHWERRNKTLLFKYLDKIENIDWWGFSGKFTWPGVVLRPSQAPGSINNPTTGIITSASGEFEKQLIQYIKSRNGKIVAGGPSIDVSKHHYTGDSIDIICEGYADNAVIAVHNHITQGTPLIYEMFQGMKLVTCDRDYKDINLGDIPVEYIENDFIGREEVFPIEISRGCIFHCDFCSFGHLGKKPGTYIRPKESIKQEILDRYYKYNTTKFLFVDDTFNDSVEKMNIIKEIRNETGIPFEFWSYARLDLLRAKPEMVDLIDQIGWTSFSFGVETFNKTSGSAVGKGANPEKLKEFLINLRNRFPNHLFHVNIILGLPEDTEESIRETINWFKENPTIASTVRIRELDIHDGRYKKNLSKIALAPGKYGYKIEPVKEGVIKGGLYWTNKNNLDKIYLNKLSTTLQEELNEIMLKNGMWPTSPPTTMKRKDLLEFDEELGRYVNKEYWRITDYIDSKLRYRNIERS